MDNEHGSYQIEGADDHRFCWFCGEHITVLCPVVCRRCESDEIRFCSDECAALHLEYEHDVRKEAA